MSLKLKKEWTIIFSIVFLIIFWSISLNGQQGKNQLGGTLRVRTFNSGLMPLLDPASPECEVVITDQIFEGLVKFDSNLQIVPQLADYWIVSPDGTRYIFYLKKGIHFHHGRLLTAKDVKVSLERLLQPGTSPFYQYFIFKINGAKEFFEGKANEVKGFVVQNNYTFEITLDQPHLSLLSILAAPFCKILPHDLLESQGKEFFYKPSGTGPFKFAYWLRDPKLRIIGVKLERNENYYGPKPFLEAIEFSSTFTLDQFIDQEIDVIPYYSPSLSRTECQVLESDSFKLIYLGFSCDRPPFNHPLVRKAINLAIDKSDLARSYFTFESMPQVLNNIIHPRLPGFFPIETRKERNIGEARSLLFKAGYFPTESFSLIDFCVLKSDRWRGERIYQRLKEQLIEIGFNLRLRLINSLKNIRTVKSPYLILFSWKIDFPDPENIIRPLFSLNSDINRMIFHYENETIENLLAMSEAEKSWGKRIEIFREIETKLLEDLPVIPLFLLNQRLAVQRYVQGIKVPTLGFSFLDMSVVWKQEKK
ncbi:MAG: ABC transporter substrate-binding protein [Candidatus Aminicenantes bacterium]|nr:ABC transporter substrate-binding protein [Candidatus Aminicenantes bacterium]